MTLQVELTVGNQKKLAELVDRTGKSTGELVNEAVESFSPATEQRSDWKERWKRIAGIWEKRSDLPDFEEIRRIFRC